MKVLHKYSKALGQGSGLHWLTISIFTCQSIQKKIFEESGGGGWDPETVRCYCQVKLSLLSEVTTQVFMEAYRDNIPKQSKQGDSISFYRTIELFCSFEKINTFLSNTRNYFLFHDVCLKIHWSELHARFIYSSVKSRLILFRRRTCMFGDRKRKFSSILTKICILCKGWSHHNSFLFYPCYQRQFWRPLLKQWIGFDPLPSNFPAFCCIFIHSSSHSVFTH